MCRQDVNEGFTITGGIVVEVDLNAQNALIGHEILRNSAAVRHHIKRQKIQKKDQRETMKATKAMEPKQDSDSRILYPDLDTRYGRIGIPAVAAAVRCKSEVRGRPAAGKTVTQYESD